MNQLYTSDRILTAADDPASYARAIAERIEAAADQGVTLTIREMRELAKAVLLLGQRASPKPTAVVVRLGEWRRPALVREPVEDWRTV